MKTFEKTPSELLNYTRKWRKFLNGATIASDEWASSSSVTIVSNTNDDDSSTVNTASGTVGDESILTCTMTDSNGEKYQRSILIKVVEYRGE